MPWRKNKKGRSNTAAVSQPNSQPSVPAPDSSPLSPTTVGVNDEKKTPPTLNGALKSTIEKAADRLQSKLATEGEIEPTAFFMHPDGTIKTVSLPLRDGYWKEALVGRIKEKALAENISTVVILSEVDGGRRVVLSGASPDAKASARLDYSFDNETKIVTSWKISWLNQPVQNVFLDGIFDKAG
ncbi:MAG TPA: hypothetical protein VMT62_07275 [Syntrophorhabdaceae bacterium]|nr:hypothetical protein [Syntrophorhabdaceae bacterium]